MNAAQNKSQSFQNTSAETSTPNAQDANSASQNINSANPAPKTKKHPSAKTAAPANRSQGMASITVNDLGDFYSTNFILGGTFCKRPSS